MKLLTLARDLKRRKARERHGLFVAEGVRTVEVLLDSGRPLRGILVASGTQADPRLARLLAEARGRGVPVEEAPEAAFVSAADTDTPQGVLAVAEIPRWRPEDLRDPARVLVLDAVQDPGNAGTMLRTAAALGVQATVTLPGTVDVWNAKVVRSAMGALCVHPVLAMTATELAAWCADRAVPIWVADADGEPLPAVAAARPTRLALVVANEGAGVSPPVAALASRAVAIPMVSGAESLNVAVAAGILLYALAPDHLTIPAVP